MQAYVNVGGQARVAMRQLHMHAPPCADHACPANVCGSNCVHVHMCGGLHLCMWVHMCVWIQTCACARAPTGIVPVLWAHRCGCGCCV